MLEEKEQLKAEIQRLQSQLAHHESQAEAYQTFKDLFDNSTDLIYIHDENGVFIDVNQSVVNKYGYSKDEVIGNTPIMFSAPDMNDLDAVVAKTASVWQGGPPESIEWWSMTKDKTIFLKELILRKGKYFGRDVIVATGRDITERKKTEDQLLNNNEELTALNEALDSFVYSASHDLKAPLLSIKGLVNLMQKDKYTDADYYLERINMAIERLTGFVNDLVEYSRNSQSSLKIESVNFNQLLIEVLHNFEFLADNNIKKIVNVGSIDNFKSDPYRIFIILNNLISNAIRYTDTCKEACYVKVLISQNKDESVTLVIEDNGIGIGKEHSTRVFEMFYRATDAKTGSGLGLYIVGETLKKLKGTIELISEEGEGTSFVIKLPNLRDYESQM